MDERLGDEAIDVVEGVHLQSKESEYSLKLNGRNMLESQEMSIPGEGDCPESLPPVFANFLEGKNLDGIAALEHHHPLANPHSMDDAGVMVEELTLKNYNGASLAVVGPSNNRDRMQTKHNNQWQHLYQLAGGSGNGSSPADAASKGNGQSTSSAWEDVGYSSFSEYLAQKPSSHDHEEVAKQLTNSENKECLSNTLLSPGGIRTKILSKSGFSEFFVKSTLGGKGVICRGPARDGVGIEFRGQNDTKPGGVAMVASDASPSLRTPLPSPHSVIGPEPGPGPDSSIDGVSLREWLNAGRLKVNKTDSLCIFWQIVDLVNGCHSKGVALQDLRPSCFKLLPSNRVRYIGSSAKREMRGSVMDQDIPYPENLQFGKRPLEQGVFPSVGLCAKKHKLSQNSDFMRQWPQFQSRSGFKLDNISAIGVNIKAPQDSGYEFNNPNSACNTQSKSICPSAFSAAQQQLTTSVRNQLEEKWYSPEEVDEEDCTLSANIYSLGVLLFELLVSFDSQKAHAAAMSDLRYRILPPNFLSENLKEAGFCLLLLHPKPSLRPTTREILQSEVISGFQGARVEVSSLSIEQEDVETELLMHFLMSLKEQKEKHASKLVEDVKCLEADIEEVEKIHSSRKSFVLGSSHNDSGNAGENRILHEEPLSPVVLSQSSPVTYANDLKLMKNISKLESAYFSMRSKIPLLETDAVTRSDIALLKNRENRFEKDGDRMKPTDRQGTFFQGLCKYAHYNKFEVRGILRNGDFMNSANVICSLSFDRDEDYFATAGVSKKIKIFEFGSLFNDSVDVHYPVIEMSNKSKLTCICWNNYIKNYLASTDYDGVVKLWDASTGQAFSQHIEHQRRAWSVDFSQVDPMKLASGSDDCSVKLWSINEKNCLGTIRSIANVCCVQFSAHSTNLLAFGSADYNTYCYDLRNTRSPWCVLAGHEKAVSLVKFVDSETLVSASTDNTLKLWDLNKTTSNGLSTNACSLTLSGHTNEKNFVGLSVADGYIACGSETNEVFAYHKSLPMPITSHKFGSIDPISGKETDDDNGLFISSVCWRGKSDMVIAANSTGCIKVLQMV